MQLIGEVLRVLEELAPLAYQESYDNAGLLCGDRTWEVKGVLLTLDVTEEVVEEAIRKGTNLIVAHHPILFKGLKRLTGSNYVERTLILAIKSNVAIYAIHTNLDNVLNGVNREIAARLGLLNVRILAPKVHQLEKLTFFVPAGQSSKVLDALFKAGAGTIGNYSHCSFRTEGTGMFLPGDGASPVIGAVNRVEEVNEHRAEVMYPAYLRPQVLMALKQSHPYEEVAYYIHLLENQNQEVGAGMYGELPEPLPVGEFLRHLKGAMNLQVIKHTIAPRSVINKVALCGGAGSFLLPEARRAGADVYVTSDYKYHEFFDAEKNIMICDIGHYESEVFTKDLLFNYLSGKFDNFALYLSEVNTNPVLYYI